MSYETERSVIEGHFETELQADANYSGLPYAFENDGFAPPGTGQSWVRLTVRSGPQVPAGIGESPSVKYRSNGVVVVQVFVPLDKGTSEQRKILDAVSSFFRGKTIDQNGQRFRFRSPQVPGGVARDGWYQTNVTIPFQRDTFH